ncbi:MAG: TM2 domain-containing protein [Anaerolineaceae bacterium]|nr:TM2 domain-containing protein [Anaerolineaceae bacterium]
MEPNSDFIAYIVVAILILAVVGSIIGLAILGKKSAERARLSDETVNRLLMSIAPEKQMLFNMQYQNVKKNPTTALVLALLLGAFGAHKFYLNQIGMGILYLVFCWTGIPSIISFIEAFTISAKVGEMNEQNANRIATMLK